MPRRYRQHAGGSRLGAMQQNANRDSWTFEQTEARLASIMRGITILATRPPRYGAPNHVLGANIAGFVRVAESMRMLGVI